jgi:hypothetical protein
MRGSIRALLLATSTAALPAFAQVTIPQEYEKTVQATRVIGALGNDLFGESISFYTGATSFSAVDVSIAGNNGLPVEARRRFIVESRSLSARNRLLSRDGGFADWELDIPYLHGIFALKKGWQVDGWSTEGNEFRCSLDFANMPEPPVVAGSPGGFWAAAEYWQGNHLHMPGTGDQEMLVTDPANTQRPADGKTYKWVTNNQWYFSCLAGTANGVPGDSFLAVDPAGNRYWFNWFAKRQVDVITKSTAGPIDTFSTDHTSSIAAAPIGSGSALSREEVRIFVTRIEDRYGNRVDYTYDSANPWRLLSISASDGRMLIFSYNATGHISAIHDGARTWVYAYGNGLTEVKLPDQSKWVIDFSTLRNAYTTPYSGTSGLMCSVSEASSVQAVFTGTIIHPSGAQGEFSFQSRTHGRSYVPKTCMKPAGLFEPIDYAKRPFLFNSVGIVQKKISGPGIVAPGVWSYAYGPPNNSWEENCASGCIATKTLEITGPGTWTRYTFGNRYRATEGQLVKVETGTSAAGVLSTEDTLYQNDPSGQPYPAVIGRSPFSRGDFMAERHAPVVQRRVLQQGVAMTYTVSEFDGFARPKVVTKSSVPSP